LSNSGTYCYSLYLPKAYKFVSLQLVTTLGPQEIHEPHPRYTSQQLPKKTDHS
jgi:hypothetical protein